MDRSISTLSDELRRNRVKEKYHPKKAQHKAYVRRKYSKFQGMKIVMHQPLRTFVEKELWEGQSPEAVSGRLKTGKENLPYVSKNSIRRFIKSPYGRSIENRRSQRKPRHRRPKRTSLTDRKFIDQRPSYIAKRGRIGDTEGDFIVSGKSGAGMLLTMVDRKSRYPFIEKIFPVTIENVHRGFVRIKKQFPEWKTMTTDNDLLFTRHRELEKLLGIKIYFCHPYHSWEKGSIENLNKHIRKDIPKSSDISQQTIRNIRIIEKRLRTRFMQCLGYLTPEEVLRTYRQKQKQRR